MDANGLSTVARTCKCLGMAYEHNDCLTNALLIPGDVNIAFLAVGCRFGIQHFPCHDTFLVHAE